MSDNTESRNTAEPSDLSASIDGGSQPTDFTEPENAGLEAAEHRSTQATDPFTRADAFQIPWDEIDAAPPETPPAEEPQAAAPEEAAPEPEAAEEPAPATEPQQEQPDPQLELAQRVERIGGQQVLDIVSPLFESSGELTDSVERATNFIDSVAKYDPAIRDGLLNALYDRFRPTLTAWADQDRGVTPERWAQFHQWTERGDSQPPAPQTRADGTAFPTAGADGIVRFPDGLELEMDNEIHRELYEARKDRYERAEQRRLDEARATEERRASEARAAEERVQIAEQQRQQRVYEYASARDRAFTQAWAEAKPDYGPDPDLQFLADFARVYAQHIAGTNPEGLKLHNEAIRLAADGGTGAEAKAAKMDLLMRKDIKSALETIDRVVRRVAARQTAAQAGQPKLPPGAVRTGVVRQGAPPERAPVSRQPGRVSLDDPESFAAVHIPWPK
jgi:hypothetical protein